MALKIVAYMISNMIGEILRGVQYDLKQMASEKGEQWREMTLTPEH